MWPRLLGDLAMRRVTRRSVPSTGLSWSLIAGLILALGIIVGIVQNSQGADVHYLFWTGHASLAVLLLATIVATVALSALAAVVWRRNRRRQLTGRAELEQLRRESRTPASVLPPSGPPAAGGPGDT